jgi:hypothetical protein
MRVVIPFAQISGKNVLVTDLLLLAVLSGTDRMGGYVRPTIPLLAEKDLAILQRLVRRKACDQESFY